MARDGGYSDITGNKVNAALQQGTRDRSSAKCGADQFQTYRSRGGAHTREAFAKRNAAWRNCLKREEALKGEAEVSSTSRTASGQRPSKIPTSRGWTPPTQRTPKRWN